MAELTDKELHCMARLQQSELLGESTECLYCKYAVQCMEEYKLSGKVPFAQLWEKLEELTGVDIQLRNPRTMQKDILAGSWIEDCPELFKEFTNMSFEEQLGSLQSPDILKYAGSRLSGI